MKRINKYKKYISLLAVLIILASICVTPAHAQIISNSGRQRLGAWIASALTALNITMNSVLAPVQSMYDYIPGALGIPTATWDDDFLDRSTIEIWEDYVVIDDVPYTDIWLSNEAAEKFRVEGFNFIDAFSIASNTNGTYASGVGTIDGVPMFSQDGGRTAYSQTYTFPWLTTSKIGNTTVYGDNTGAMQWSGTFSNGTTFGTTYGGALGNPQAGGYYYYFRPYSESKLYLGSYKSSTGQVQNSSSFIAPASVVNMTPFDFDYVSGTIPADTVLPSDTGMMIRVPSSTLEPFFDIHPDFTVNAPVEIDFTLDPTLKVDMDDLIDVLLPVIADLDIGDINFIENHETPAPVINNLLPDTYKNEILNPIINEFHDQQTIINELPDQITGPIIEAIPTIDDICNNIDAAPINDLDTGVTRLPSLLLPYITDLRSALGIWHYVTEWISQINTVFTFILGILAGTTILTPIYAAIAGYICIRVYRRMCG